MNGLFERLKASCQDDWQAYVTHPFVEQLGAGSLPLDCFKHYLGQDYIFLMHFARAYALAVFKSEHLDDMRQAAGTLDALLNSEMSLHIRFCARWGLDEDALMDLPEACTPTTTGTFNFTVLANDGDQEVEQPLGITVIEVGTGPLMALRADFDLSGLTPSGPYDCMRHVWDFNGTLAVGESFTIRIFDNDGGPPVGTRVLNNTFGIPIDNVGYEMSMPAPALADGIGFLLVQFSQEIDVESLMVNGQVPGCNVASTDFVPATLTVIPAVIDSIILDTTTVTIDGPTVGYTATISNFTGSDLSTVVLQGSIIDQFGVVKPAGGSNVCVGFTGDLPPGGCSYNFTVIANNNLGGEDSFSAGPATARFELFIFDGEGTVTVDTLTVPITLRIEPIG